MFCSNELRPILNVQADSIRAKVFLLVFHSCYYHDFFFLFRFLIGLLCMFYIRRLFPSIFLLQTFLDCSLFCEKCERVARYTNRARLRGHAPSRELQTFRFSHVLRVLRVSRDACISPSLLLFLRNQRLLADCAGKWNCENDCY